MRCLNTILTIIAISGSITGFSQKQNIQSEKRIKTLKQHRFILQATGLYNINRNSGREFFVHTKPGTSPIRSMHINNTFGYQAGVGYEYRNKKMITFSPSILYGVQNISYDNYYNLDFIDPVYEFPRHTSLVKVRMTSAYLAPSFSLGYDYQAPKNQNLVFQGKLGLSSLYPLKDMNRQSRLFVNYHKGTDTSGALQFAYTEVGQNNSFIGHPFYNVYIGVAYKAHCSFIKDIRAGITFTHAFGFFTGEDFIRTASNQYIDKKQVIGVEDYYDRFRNVGATVSVGF